MFPLIGQLIGQWGKCLDLCSFDVNSVLLTTNTVYLQESQVEMWHVKGIWSAVEKSFNIKCFVVAFHRT